MRQKKNIFLTTTIINFSKQTKQLFYLKKKLNAKLINLTAVKIIVNVNFVCRLKIFQCELFMNNLRKLAYFDSCQN